MDRADAQGPEAILAVVLDAVDDTSTRGIASAIGRLITQGRLKPGERLPTVRLISNRLGVSPTTVSQAWRSLAKVGLVSPRGRNGTFVRGDGHPSPARRMLRVYENPGSLELDLSTGTPDPLLIPDLAAALSRVAKRRFASRYADRPVLPELEELLRSRWPFEAEGLTVLNGALDALDRIVALQVRFGDRVLVDNPCFPPILDLLENQGAEPIPVPVDEEGLIPAALMAGLEREPRMLLTQPRAHNPAGVSLSPARARQLAGILEDRPVLVVEDDHVGDIASAEPVSLGSYIPDQVTHISSFSKSHGPDLRLAAVGGPAEVIDAIDERRLLGPGWSSRLLQAVLVDLLTDADSVAAVQVARRTYARRRQALSDRLREAGVTTMGADGINLWMEVAHEPTAVIVCAAAGLGVAPGSPFEVEPLGASHLRVTVGLVPEELTERVAQILVTASRSVGRSLLMPSSER